jgi:hypothetical protein
MAAIPGSIDMLREMAFKPGQSGNPGGKAQGARNKLQGKFLNALAADFEAHGKEAIEACRHEDPAAYIRAIVALMPKELEVRRPLDDLTDEQLESIIASVSAIDAARHSSSGAAEAPGGESAAGLSSVPQAG